MRISDWSSDVCSSDLEDLVDRDLRDGHIGLQTHVDQRLFHAAALDRIGFVGRIRYLRTDRQHHFRRRAPADLRLDRRRVDLDGLVEACARIGLQRSEEHTSELQSLMRISYAVFCLKKKNKHQNKTR